MRGAKLKTKRMENKMSQFEQIKEQLSLGGDYAAVAAKYRPIFAEIAQEP